MEYAQLGLTEASVSRIGFGCAAIGGYDYGKVNDEESIAAIRKALDLDINLFDTADVYGFGHSEEILAKALGPARHRVIIATKFGVTWDDRGRTRRDISAKTVEEAINGSLRRLGLDCIPLYQVHWPDGRTPIAETMTALMRCRERGKIRWVGCCNFPPELVREAQSYCRLESLQMPFSLLQDQTVEMLAGDLATSKATVLCYNVLAQGFFGGKYGTDTRFVGTDLRRNSILFESQKLESNLLVLEKVKAVAECHGKTPAQVAIRWVLDASPNLCALTGAKNAAQITENAGAAGWKLSGEDLACLGRDIRRYAVARN